MNNTEMVNAVKRAKAGDAAAFGEIYASLKNEAYRFALYYLRDSADAEDAVQSAALRAWRGIGSLKKAESFRSWFFKTEYNECISLLNARKKAALSLESLPEVSDGSGESMFLSVALEDAMRSLSETDRAIVELSVLSGFRSAEISEIVGLRPSSVRSRLSRALRSLRETLEKDGIK